MALSIRGKTRFAAGSIIRANPFDNYKVGSFSPLLVSDFAGVNNNDNEYYRKAGSVSTFSDMFTHSRLGNATMVDSDGLIKWAPHNLMMYSQEIDNAAYTNLTGMTISANAGTDPDGNATAEQMIEDETPTGKNLNLPAVTLVANTEYTAEFEVKANGRNWFMMLFASASGLGTSFAYFDVANGVVGTSNNIVSHSIAATSNGYYLCTVKYIPTSAGSHSHAVRMIDTDKGIRLPSYTGDGSSGQFWWGFRQYRSDLGGMVNNPDRGDSYVPTTSAAVYQARRNHYTYNGTSWANSGLLLETEARTNYLVYSEDFSKAFWVARSFTKVGTVAGPLGSVGYEFIEDDTDANPAIYYNADVTDGTPRTFGVWLKASAPVTIALSTNSNVKTTDINVTTEWQFFWCSDSVNAGIGPHIGGFFTITRGSGITLYAAMSQQENGSTPSSYMPTAGATFTRSTESLQIAAADMPWPTPNYLTGNLVDNGDFELGDNGDWTLNGTAEITTGTAKNLTGGDYIAQGFATEAGKYYQLTFDALPGSNTGNSLVRIGTSVNSFSIQATSIGSTGTGLVRRFVATGATTWVTFYQANFTSEYDNISVREIDPLSVSLQMQGKMTYADTDSAAEAEPFNWSLNSSNEIFTRLDTTGGTGRVNFFQYESGIADVVLGAHTYSPDILVPYNIASRHGSTFINGAVDGTALTENITPTALPDLSTSDFDLGSDYMGTIAQFRAWNVDIGDSGIEQAST